MAGVLDEDDEEIERLWREADRLAATQQPMFDRFEAKWPEVIRFHHIPNPLLRCS